MKNQLLSVGIDIGTTTTQLVFSKIYFKNQASIFTVPRVGISKKDVVYRSEIHFTPLIDNKYIDYDKVVEIVDYEYKKANVRKESIDIGAVIITGETARKVNSKEVLHKLSDYSGDFVVASAGAKLESVIAAKGAGVDTYSKENFKTVLHIDIGGGTSNYCVLKDGFVIDTGCLDIGGRIIKLNSGVVTYLTSKAQDIIDTYNLDIKIGKNVRYVELEKFCDILCEIFEASVNVGNHTLLYKMITDKNISNAYNIDFISFSGGVSEVIYDSSKYSNDYMFDDIGIILGKKILQSRLFKDYKVIKGDNTMQATVVGAGSHTTKLSGSTIYCDYKDLPVKNVGAIEVRADNIFEDISNKMEWFEKDAKVALVIHGTNFHSYNELDKLSNNIITAMKAYIDNTRTLFVVVKDDFAKALGFLLKSKIDDNVGIIVIDSVDVREQDYIDFAYPIANDQVIPVVVKTILFN